MLAGSADDASEAIGELGEAALEYKLDGARIQIHKSGDQVAVYSRRLNDVTAAVPEVVEAVRGAPGPGADPRRRGDRAPGERHARTRSRPR